MSGSGKRDDGGMFHEGERTVQRRAGVAAMSDRVANGIHTTLPEAARAFLREQPFAVLGGRDPQGRVWASPIWGAAGFLTAPDPTTISIAPLPGGSDDDPLHAVLADPGDGAVAMVGLLVIDPATRRRMRANGRASAHHPQGLRIHVGQAYANCPKYIQKRRIIAPAETMDSGPAAARYHGMLRPEHRMLVAEADTFFIATAHPDRGADASHRGGNPGFVTVSEAGSTLVWPDYAGNAMFNTLGNLAVSPAAGLLFIGWDNGAILQITGEAETVWSGPDVERLPGAERAVRFRVGEVVYREAAFPLRYRFEEASPFNPSCRPPDGVHQRAR